jgi:hypothetical protein
MPAFRIERTAAGRWRLGAAGCCSGGDAVRRGYEQAFLEQELAEGGRVVSAGPEGVELVDHRGRVHRLDAGVCVPGATPSAASPR